MTTLSEVVTDIKNASGMSVDGLNFEAPDIIKAKKSIFIDFLKKQTNRAGGFNVDVIKEAINRPNTLKDTLNRIKSKPVAIAQLDRSDITDVIAALNKSNVASDKIVAGILSHTAEDSTNTESVDLAKLDSLVNSYAVHSEEIKLMPEYENIKNAIEAGYEDNQLRSELNKFDTMLFHRLQTLNANKQFKEDIENFKKQNKDFSVTVPIQNTTSIYPEKNGKKFNYGVVLTSESKAHIEKYMKEQAKGNSVSMLTSIFIRRARMSGLTNILSIEEIKTSEVKDIQDLSTIVSNIINLYNIELSADDIDTVINIVNNNIRSDYTLFRIDIIIRTAILTLDSLSDEESDIILDDLMHRLSLDDGLTAAIFDNPNLEQVSKIKERFLDIITERFLSGNDIRTVLIRTKDINEGLPEKLVESHKVFFGSLLNDNE